MKPVRLAVLAVVALLALPATALAAPTVWAGTDANDLGPASVILSVTNRRVKVTNFQLVLACTDAEDGTESSRAFSGNYRTSVALSRNRFDFHFSKSSGGRLGEVRLRGTLGSNGRGTVWLDVNAVGVGEHGETVERCSGAVRFAVRRGPRS